jgi:hypothetical protein
MRKNKNIQDIYRLHSISSNLTGPLSAISTSVGILICRKMVHFYFSLGKQSRLSCFPSLNRFLSKLHALKCKAPKRALTKTGEPNHVVVSQDLAWRLDIHANKAKQKTRQSRQDRIEYTPRQVKTNQDKKTRIQNKTRDGSRENIRPETETPRC